MQAVLQTGWPPMQASTLLCCCNVLSSYKLLRQQGVVVFTRPSRAKTAWCPTAYDYSKNIAASPIWVVQHLTGLQHAAHVVFKPLKTSDYSVTNAAGMLEWWRGGGCVTAMPTLSC